MMQRLVTQTDRRKRMELPLEGCRNNLNHLTSCAQGGGGGEGVFDETARKTQKEVRAQSSG